MSNRKIALVFASYKELKTLPILLKELSMYLNSQHVIIVSDDSPEEIRMELFTGGGNIKIYDINGNDDKQRFINFLQKYDQTSLDVFNGAPLPKMPGDAEPDDFMSQIDEIDFSDKSLFVDSIVDEINNLDFDDPDLFN